MEYDFSSMLGFAWLIAIGIALAVVGVSAYLVVAPSSDRSTRLVFVGFLGLAVVVFGGVYLIEDAGGSTTAVAIGSMVRFGSVVYLGVAAVCFKVLEATGGLGRRQASPTTADSSSVRLDSEVEPWEEPTSRTPFETSASSTPGVGDAVADSGLGFVVTTVESPGKHYPPSGGLRDLAIGKWLIVHLTVMNICDQVRWLDAQEQLLLEDDLFELEAEHSTLSGADYEALAPGEQVDTLLMFDVPLGFPDDCSGAVVELHGVGDSMGVEVHLY